MIANTRFPRAPGQQADAGQVIEHLTSSRGEQFITDMLRLCMLPSASAKHPPLDDLIGFTAEVDCPIFEMPLRIGRADLVIFHIDGTVTVIEVKDGSKGFSHVAAGIGQSILYATQLVITGQAKTVRRALLWTSTGNTWCDVLLSSACKQADVIPIMWGSLEDHRQGFMSSINKEAAHGAA